MAERITFASWDFIELICVEHNETLNLVMSKNQPVYKCSHERCSTQIPAYVYEKLYEDVINRLNNNEFTVGDVWRKQIKGKSYEFKITVFTFGKKAEILVKNLDV